MRRINLPLLLAIVIAALLGTVAVYFVHRFQVQRNAENIALRAEQTLEAGEAGEALKLYARYASLRPDDGERYGQFARLLLSRATAEGATRNDIRKAYGALEKAVRKTPNDRELREVFALFLIRRGEFSAARENLLLLREGRRTEEGIDAAAVRARIDLMYATASAAVGKNDDAVAALSELIGFDTGSKSFRGDFILPPGRTEAFVMLAEIMEKRLHYPSTAANIISRMVEAYPDDTQAFLAEALWQDEHDAPEAAMAAAARASKLNPEDADTMYVEFLLAMRQKRYEDAAEIINVRMADVASSERMILGRADVALALGDTAGMIDLLREGLTKIPASQRLLTRLVVALADLKRFDELRPILEESREKLGKESVPTLYAEGSVAMEERRWLQAQQLWEKLRPMVAGDDSYVRMIDLRLAACHAMLGQADAVSDAGSRILSTNPSSLQAKLAMAVGHEQAGRATEALTLREEIAAAIPAEKLLENVELWGPLLRLRIAVQLNLPADERDWSKVDSLLALLEESPGVSAELREGLAVDVLTAKGDREAALERCEAAVLANPDSPGLIGALSLLLQSAGQMERARTLIGGVPEAARTTPAVLRAMSLLALNAPPAEAQAMLAEVEKRAGELPPTAANQVLKSLVTSQLQIGKPAEAERLAGIVIERAPEDLPTRLLLLEITAESGDTAKVTRCADDIRRIAGAETATGRLAKAVTLIVKVRQSRIKRGINDPGGESLTADDVRDLDDARKLLVEAQSDRRKWAEIPRLFAEIALLKGDQAAAVGQYRRAVEMGEEQAPARRRLAMALHGAGRLDEAQKVIDSLGDAGGDQMQRIAAEIDARNGRFQAAIDRGAAVISADNRDPEQLIWYARLLGQCGKPERAEEILKRAVEAAPKRVDSWLVLIGLQARLGQRQAAVETLRKAQQAVDESTQEQLTERGQELIGDLEVVEKAYRGNVAASPDDPEAAQKLAEFFLRQGRQADARQELMRIADLAGARGTPALVWARRTLARMSARSGSYRDFQEGLSQLALNVDSAGRQSEQDLTLAIALLRERPEPSSWRQAMQLFETLSRQRPLSVDEQVDQARLEATLGSWQKARDQLQGIASSPDTSPGAIAILIEELLKHGEIVAAKAWMVKLLDVAPGTPTALWLEAKLALADSDQEGATRAAEKLMSGESLTPGNAQRLLSAARMVEDLGFPDPAERVLREYATAAVPGTLALAAFLGRQHRTAEALDLVETIRGKISAVSFLDALIAIMQNSGGQGDSASDERVAGWLESAERENPDSAEVAIQAAVIAEMLGRTSDAERIYRGLLARETLPSLQAAIISANLAWLLQRGGGAAEVDALIDRAILELGRNPDILDTRALIRLERGQVRLALEDLEEAILVPSALKSLHLAVAHAQAGSLPEARKALARSKELGIGSQRLSPEDLKRMEQVEAATAVDAGA